MRLILIVLCFGLFCQMHSQNTVGLISYEEDRSSDGYHLLFAHNQANVYLFDHCGRVVHSWEDEDSFVPGNSVYLLDNGNLVKCKRRQTSAINDPIWAGGGGETVEIRSWQNDILATFTLNDSLYRLHHDVAPLPNGNVVLLAWEALIETEALAAGRSPELLDQRVLWSEALFEWDPIADSVVWEWHATDHLIQDQDSSRLNFGRVSEHPELIDLNFAEDGHPDWLHANSIDYNPVLDQLVLSIPSFNEFWIIDHSTTTAEAAGHSGGRSGKGGDILHRWGNPQSYDQGDSSDQRLFFQHDVNWTHPQALEGEEGFGQVILFNNRVPGFRSTINLVQTTESDGKYQMTDGSYEPTDFSQVWAHPDSLTIAYSASLSSAQLLPNGNVLALSGRWGFAYELTTDEDVVWEYRVPFKGGNPVEQGDTLDISNNITFRLKRIPIDHLGLQGRELTPDNYLELNPDTLFCSSITTSLQAVDLDLEFFVHPNPTYGDLNVSLPQQAIGQQISIFDAQGRLMKQTTVFDLDTRLSMEGASAGLYILKVGALGAKKFLVQ